MREDFIHFHARAGLRGLGWTLIAGEYPNGSDDELRPLMILDPVIARDNSPDPRRHSKLKLVPDLVALNGEKLLIIEAKPSFDAGDEAKLRTIVGDRRADLFTALKALFGVLKIALSTDTLELYPCLAMERGKEMLAPVDMSTLGVEPSGRIHLSLAGGPL